MPKKGEKASPEELEKRQRSRAELGPRTKTRERAEYNPTLEPRRSISHRIIGRWRDHKPDN